MEASRRENGSQRAIARILAPLALVAALVVLVVVIESSLGPSDDGKGDRHPARAQSDQRAQRPEEDTYVVQQGDTLSGIAEKTGVSVDDLQRLNPDVDTQALAPGSTLKLR